MNWGSIMALYLKSQDGREFFFRAHAYGAGVDQFGEAHGARLIVGFSAGGMDSSIGFISPGDVRRMAAHMIEQANKAEGIEQ